MTKMSMTARITKLNDEKQLVYGWASIVTKDGLEVVDRQGDVIEIDDLRDAAHDYLTKSRKGGYMHHNGRVIGEVVESIIIDEEFRKAFGAPETGPTGWFIALRVSDSAVWQQVRNGQLAAFSIGGSGTRVPT